MKLEDVIIKCKWSKVRYDFCSPNYYEACKIKNHGGCRSCAINGKFDQDNMLYQNLEHMYHDNCENIVGPGGGFIVKTPMGNECHIPLCADCLKTYLKSMTNATSLLTVDEMMALHEYVSESIKKY